MNIKELGGEFKLIERITRAPVDKNVILGIGDDAAVIKFGGKHMVVTSDMICEGDHFSRDYFTPEQIGIKAMVSNLSDIAAMGGRPLYALMSVALTRDTTVETMEGIYRGLYDAAGEYHTEIIGGDTTHSSAMVINVTLLGDIRPERIRTRGGAKPGDIIKVSGSLGASTAGLKLFLRKIAGFEKVKKKHTQPSCRLDISDQVAEHATSMEDVSDGLASEVRNICYMSGAGALIYYDKIPVDPDTARAGRVLGDDPVDYALYGGEDFELTYTVPRERAARVPGTEVGEIISKEGVYLVKDGEQIKLEKFGYDHFA